MPRWGPVVLRLAVGAVFVAHGLPKLVPIWGQGGPEATAAFFDSLGLRPAMPLALATGVVETLGGAALILGAFTPYACVALIAVMGVALWTTHAAHGFFLNWAVTPGVGHGYEFNLVLVAALASLALTGPGALSFDHRRARDEESWRAGRARIVRRY
jgi:putative oxidoreductase